ncbi:hypothetical protein FA15DRAFT_752858 [Coprinopsis marcescibilis]|uniref:Alpha/beta-hydrolase n=1 Tax=Coprinopsis marcescibilis TaxID=230819 RepID=A0A5C3L9W4_COPMA|nr:hypothetical protein FA15DRAFT_752858 [Coprinopsis marcescibilis]
MSDISELQEPLLRRTRCFYTTLFTLVLPIWSVIPLSWAFVLYSLYTGRVWLYKTLGVSFFLVALCEVFFSVYHYHLALQVSNVTGPVSWPELNEIQVALNRLLNAGLSPLPGSEVTEGHDEVSHLAYDDPRAVDFRNSLRNWFRKVPWSSVKLEEVRKWLYWCIYNSKYQTYEHLPDAHREAIDSTVDQLEKRMGCTIPPGRNHDIRPLCQTLDPVPIYNRPLVFYALIKTINLTLQKYYETKWNARLGSYEDLEYILRIPNGWDYMTSPRPLVFIHGLGMGLLQYHLLLSHMFETISDRPILVLIQPQISQDVFHPRFLQPMDRQQMSNKLAELLRVLGWAHVEYSDEDFVNDEEGEVANQLVGKGVTVISHSNGSYTHAWMLKEHPQLVTRSCFVDPVTFCSWEGDVCYNFLYRAPRTGMELLMKYFVCTELGSANLLHRHFDWVANALWCEDIPNVRDPSKTIFFLGGKDEILDCQRVRRYLSSHGVHKNVWCDPKARHGEVLMTGSLGHTEILRWLHEPEDL